MTWKQVGSVAAALALLAFASTFDSAKARHGGGHTGGHFGGGHHFSGGGHHFSGVRHFSVHPHFAVRHHHFRHHVVFLHRHFRHHRFHRHRFFVVGAYPYYYGDGCYWLKRRALYTGSPYWWRRYYACRHGYY